MLTLQLTTGPFQSKLLCSVMLLFIYLFEIWLYSLQILGYKGFCNKWLIDLISSLNNYIKLGYHFKNRLISDFMLIYKVKEP